MATQYGYAVERCGVGDGSSGSDYTRTGRSFFADPAPLVDQLRTSCAPLFASLETDWLVLDCELLPWSAKALGLIREQYAAAGAAARTALSAASALLGQAAGGGLDVADLADRMTARTANAEAFRPAYTGYCTPVGGPDGLDGVQVAPFQVLAAEGRALGQTEPHAWHLEQLGALTDPLLRPTRHRTVELADPASRSAAVDWWLTLTDAGRGDGGQASIPGGAGPPGAAGAEGARP